MTAKPDQRRILLISRKFPPSVGGAEEYVYQLHRQLAANEQCWRITLGRSQKHLLWFVPWAFLAGLAIIVRHRITHLHVCDAVLAPLGLLLSRISGTRLSLTVWGLDVIYRNPLFQRLVRTFLPCCEKIVCISRATREVCVERGVAADACLVIPCGIDPLAVRRRSAWPTARVTLGNRLGMDLAGRRLLTTVGRLVPRKGVAWFIEKVMPLLPPDVMYVVVGGGPELAAVRAAANRVGVEDRVLFLGKVAEELKELVYDGADLFVMPNRRVAGDMEGFGIVALEAGMHDLPVVATGIEGIVDAVVEGVTGRFAPEEDAQAFVGAIEEAMTMDRSRIAQTVSERYSWETVYRQYAVQVFAGTGLS
jgi:phosphatidyl-myo-inositol dimannoside synthase